MSATSSSSTSPSSSSSASSSSSSCSSSSYSPLINYLHIHFKRWFYFSLTTAILVLCFSNTINRILHTLYSSSFALFSSSSSTATILNQHHHLFDRLWQTLISSSGYSHFTIFMLGSSLIHMSLYWTVGLFFLYFDLRTTPSSSSSSPFSSSHALAPFKMQPLKNAPFDANKIWPCVRQVLFNQLAVGVPTAALYYPLCLYCGVSIAGPLPTFTRFLSELALIVLIEEIGFYSVHRAFHSPALYGRFHKQHHEFTAPIAIATNYCSAVEHAFANILPVFIGPLVCGSHLATIWIWQALATLLSINSHCGYHLPFFPSSESHDMHHLKFNVNYGVLGVLDYLFSTDVTFRNSPQFVRHKTYFSLDPAKYHQDSQFLIRSSDACNKTISKAA